MYKKIMIASCILSVMGCGANKHSMGIRKDSPDEFVVISHHSLKEPPAFKIEEPRSKEISFIQNKNPISSNVLSKADQEFLHTIGLHHTTELQRDLDMEAAKLKSEIRTKNSLSRVVATIRGEADEPFVDAPDEEKRIRSNLETGQTVNTGKVKQKTRSTIERLLN